jgi:hypothetical protein
MLLSVILQFLCCCFQRVFSMGFNAGKAVFVNRSLCSTKHACKGITSGLKKSPHSVVALRLVLTAGVAACFVSYGRSFLMRGYSCPLKPQ